MADFKNLVTRDAANEGAWVTIPNPKDGTMTKMRLLILGKDSDVYRKTEAEHRRRMISSANITGSFRLSDEAMEEHALELMVACTIDWDGFVEDGDAEVKVAAPFSKEEVLRLYKEAPFVRELVDKSIGDRTLFAGR